MNRHYFIKTIEDGTIIDCISYQYLDYVSIEVDFDGEILLRGYYKYLNGSLIKDEVKEAEWLANEQKMIAEMQEKENSENHNE